MNLMQMSLAGAVMILVIIVIRAMFINKLPKKTFLALWGVVAARLLIPCSFRSAFSIYSLLGRLTAMTEAVKKSSSTTPFTPMTLIYNVAPVPGIATADTTAAVLVDLWGIVWTVGALVCAGFFVAAYLKCRREFKTSWPVDNGYVKVWLKEHRIYRTIEIRQSGRIRTPLTYGVFRPVILMPKTTDWDDLDTLKYVLTHEYVHIRRFDAVSKAVLVVILCIHWFNPAVWIMYVLANRDIELSCDEAVVRRFGECTKAAYAMTLIRMEETRSRLNPLYNHFSKNAIEKRIIAIMKIKKTTLATLITASVLVAGVMTVFATSAQTDENTASEVEWWTYDEYKTWLEKEKVELQGMIGQKAYTGSRGEFVWTQEIVDETIAMYEDILENIKNGMRYSKTDSEGDVFVMSSDLLAGEEQVHGDFDPEISVAEGNATAQGAGGNRVPAQNNADTFQGTLDMDAKNAKLIANSKWFPNYEQYGLSYDAQQGVLSYNGQLISFFHDETAPGVYTHVNFSQGTVGIEVKRNADWEIVGLVEYSTWADDVIVQEGSLEQTAVTDRTISSTDFYEPTLYEPTRDELLAEYEKFGISFDISGKMLYQNKPVRWFADFVELEEGALATRYVYRNDEGTEYIHTVRNRIYNGDGSYDPFGPLLEIVSWETGERDDFGFLFQGSQINATAEAIGNDNADGITFEKQFSRYKDFGITYVEADGASGRGNVYLNGSLVSRFADIAPDGSAFTFSSAQPGDFDVKTVYDDDGRLTGVEIAD